MISHSSAVAADTDQPVAEPVDVSIDRFMSIAAHDLRNPISVIRGSAQMALRHVARGDTEAARRRLEVVVQQSERMGDVVDAFSDAARITTGALSLRTEPVDVADLAHEVLEQERRLRDREERQLDVALDTGCRVVGDRLRLGRVLRALVDNAYRYGSEEHPVRVRMARQGDAVVLRVSGGGSGPTPEERMRLFELFFRGHAAAEAGHAGSGLGLFNARGIARAHGGDVRLVEDGAPDEFELRLPLAV